MHQLEMPQQLFLEDSNANTEGSDDSENINNNNTGGNADTNSGNASGSNNNNSKATRRTRRCHICKAIHNEVHFFYDQVLCIPSSRALLTSVDVPFMWRFQLCKAEPDSPGS